MFDNTNQNCQFSESTAAFLYGELDRESRAAFNAHLQTCAPCADELKSFGAVRASISYWRALEFDTLAAPAIEIEYAAKNQGENFAAVPAQNASWLERLCAAFSFRPAFAAAFAALLFACVCAGLIAHNFGGDNQVAQMSDESNAAASDGKILTPNENGDSSASEIARDVSPSATDGNKNVSSPEARKDDAPQRIVKVSGVAVKPTREATRKIYNAPANRRTFDLNSSAAQNEVAANVRRAPKLSGNEDLDEEETASLRLTDLLDDAGGK